MDFDELAELFQYYSKKLNEYDKALEHADEIDDYEFGSSDISWERQKAKKALEEGLNKYIEQRIGLFLNQVIALVKEHYNIQDE